MEMSRMRRARKELLAYNVLKLNRVEIAAQIQLMDADIRPKTTFIDGMPRAKGGLPKSTVENQASYREQQLKSLEAKLRSANQRIDFIEWVLQKLSPVEQRVVTLSFFAVDLDGDEEIAESLSLTAPELANIKRGALHFIGYTLECYSNSDTA